MTYTRTDKACLVCGRPTATNRCAEHTQPPRGAAHRKAALLVVRAATTCAQCGKPPTPTDPLTADHIVPRSHGGPDHVSNMRAIHRSCNSRRGAGVYASARKQQRSPAKFSGEKSA